MINYYIAIDGGGTKTDIVLFDDIGTIHNRVIGESTNPNALTEAEIEERLKLMFTDLFTNKNIQHIKSCFAGMSGADHPHFNTLLKKAITASLPVIVDTIRVENDAVTALWSGTYGDAGIVLIAGTGSILYGRYESGESFRIGGWGHLISDEGSGYSVGQKALAYALKAFDGIKPKGILFEKLLKHYNIKKMSDVIPILYNGTKPPLASLVPIVVEAADQGDTSANTILEQTIENLSDLLAAGLEKYNQYNCKVVVAGGLWNVNRILSGVKDKVDHPIIRPTAPPVFGSMIGALGVERNPNLLEKLQLSLEQYN